MIITKETYPDGEIKVALESLLNYSKISIKDYGVGIASDEWNSIFKRFYRGRNTKGTSGAGLGLYLAALILQKQGGYIH